jgi:hypothetical protein
MPLLCGLGRLEGILNLLVVANDFINDEAQEFLRKLRVKVRIGRKAT